MPDLWLPPYLRLDAALAQFATVLETQAQRHIKPLHQYLAIRLAIEGGFHPDEITPHPPLLIEGSAGRLRLSFEEHAQRENEQTVLGGLKTKDIDVVVAKPGIGLVIAISVKGTGGAFRNLTNRMEEAIGDSTKDIHAFAESRRGRRRRTQTSQTDGLPPDVNPDTGSQP